MILKNAINRRSKKLNLKKFALIAFLIVIFNFYFSYSQGFDWQTSGRLPYNVPQLFVGFSSNYAVNFHNGEFNLNEDFIECCNFTEGSGNGFSFGIKSEYWLDGLSAVSAGINFNNTRGEFLTRSVLPTRNGDFITEYGFNSDITNLNLEFLYRRRIKQTHFSIGGGIVFSALISSNSDYTEQALSNNVPFELRTINNGGINQLNSLLISPLIFFAYDVSLGIGYYASPNLSITYNLNSRIEDEPWRTFSLLFGIRIFRNL